MKLLAEISDKSLGLSEVEILGKSYELRKSARVILVNQSGEVAVQYLANHFFHKLPGGGVETGEEIEVALKREVREEVGCDVDILGEVGMVIEYREKHSLLHISYCFTANVAGEISEPNLEQAEIDEGTTTLWMRAEEAIQKMETDVPNTYQGRFILQRELAFLREYAGTK